MLVSMALSGYSRRLPHSSLKDGPTVESKQPGTEKIDVSYVANLARLHLTEEERQLFQQQLEEIVGYVRKIGALDTAGIEPTSHACVVQNVFREDEVRPGLDHADVLDNAPVSANEQFMVPKIVE